MKDVRGEVREFLTTRRAKVTPEQAGLVGELSLRSQPFRERWAAHDVEYYRSGIQPFRHPLAGDLDLGYDALEIPADPGQIIIAYSAEPGSAAHQALGVLASWDARADRRKGRTRG